MPGIGTVINVTAIICGGLLGLNFGHLLKARVQETLMVACGLGTMFLGIAGAVEKMLVIKQGGLTSTSSLMMILSLAIGGLLGELLNLEGYFEAFGHFLKHKTGNSKDPAFTKAFVDASLVVCIGAMAIVGAINDGIYHKPETLIAKSILDFVIVMVMTSAEGRGCIFSFVSVGILQGSITLLAHFIRPIMTSAALSNISLVGSILIFCVGLNLLWEKKVRVANFLPSLVVAVIFAFIPNL